MVVELRRMHVDDVELLTAWDTDPDIAAALGGAGADWYDWHRELDRELNWRELLIVMDSGVPVGFVQLLDAYRDETGYWGDVLPGTWSLDIWIGSPADRGRGVGSKAMRAALERIFIRPEAEFVIVDPKVDNVRAIAFYLGLGFEQVEERTLDGDRCLIMRFDRPGAEVAR